MRLPKMLCIVFLLGGISQLAYPQTTPSNDQVLIQIGNSDYSLSEFDYYFLKNTERPSQEAAKKATNEYLDLFINFKLKVQEALSMKMDQEEGFIMEFDGYKAQLIEPFLSTSKVNEDLIKEAYDRLQYEIAATHILIKPKDNNSPDDTLQTFNQLVELKKRIQNGEDMASLAKKYSHDRSAANNGGYLGYFTAMQMVYPFENAVYSTPVGEVAGPFTTRFGYHIVRIEDKRPARGQAKAAHIMVRYTQEPESEEKARLKVNSIYQSIQEGKDWNELCKLYSDDKNTSSNGGELKWFGTGQLVPEFEDMAFSYTLSIIALPFIISNGLPGNLLES